MGHWTIVLLLGIIFLFTGLENISAQSDYWVFIPFGTDVPGCEETNSCYDSFHTVVEVGDTVTWINDDVVAHTVTSGVVPDGYDGIFGSDILGTGEEFVYTFNQAGTYSYFCMIHPWMDGIISVADVSIGAIDLEWDLSSFDVVSWEGDPIVPAVFEKFQIWSTVRNTGTLDSNPFDYALDIYDEDGILIFTEERRFSIEGASTIGNAWIITLDDGGEYFAEFFIDWNDEIIEEDEGNNYYEFSFFVQGVPRTTDPIIYFDKSTYQEGEPMVVVLEDDFANQDPNSIDEVEIGLEFVPIGEISWGLVDETGLDTGVFKIETTAPPLPYDGDIRLWYPYDKSDGSMSSMTYTAFVYALEGGTTAVIQTDKSTYIPGTDMIITIIEPDGDVSSFVDRISAINIIVNYKGIQVSILDPMFDASDSWLTETEFNSGIFQIIAKIPTQIGSNTLKDGDTIELQYVDESPDSGSTETVSKIINILVPSDTSQPDPDSDGDGTPDSKDGCPNDPNKTAPGIAGCGVSDEKPVSKTVKVSIPVGTDVRGCETNNSCFSPYTTNVNVGDTVTWTNDDTASHTVTSGNPLQGGPDGKFDSSLFKSGESFSETFQSTGTYHYFCRVHAWMEGEVVVGSRDDVGIPTPISPFRVSTDSVSYNAGDIVKVSVSGLADSKNVAISVTSPNGNTIISRTVTTDSSGNGSLEFGIPDSAVSGTYMLTGTAQIGSQPETSGNTFEVVPGTFGGFDSGVSIVSITPTDRDGKPVTSFNTGQLSFAKVVISSDSPKSALVTVNLFDSGLTTLGIASFQTTLSGQSEVVMSFNIPSDAAQGTANIYANVFSDWPSNGGVALTSEKSANVLIP